MGLNILTSKLYILPFILKPLLVSLKRSEPSNMKDLMKETARTHFSRRGEPQHYIHSRSSRDYWTQMTTTSQVGISVVTCLDYIAICERNVRVWNRLGWGHSLETPWKLQLAALLAAGSFLCYRHGSVHVGIACSWWYLVELCRMTSVMRTSPFPYHHPSKPFVMALKNSKFQNYSKQTKHIY
jgi:hypothetical protein